MGIKRNFTLVIPAAITLCMVLVLSGCFFTPAGSKIKSGDLIISPESEQKVTNNNASNILLNNRINNSNISAANNAQTQLSAGMVYDKIDKNTPWIDIDADGKNLYLLRNSDHADTPARYGNVIEVYDSESQTKKFDIRHEKLKFCSAVSVGGERVHAYDAQSGKIFSFLTDGQLQGINDSTLRGLLVDKMEIGNDGYIFLTAYDSKASQSAIYILDSTFKRIDKVDGDLLKKDLKDDVDGNTNIQDFCIKEKDYILIKLLPSRLVLYNYKTHRLEKLCAISDDTAYISYDGGILYCASGRSLGVFTNNLTNFSYKGNLSVISRVLMNEQYPWTMNTEKLSDWYLGDLNIPFTRENFYHKKMAQTNKYIYLLDEKLPLSGENSNIESVIYRVLK